MTGRLNDDVALELMGVARTCARKHELSMSLAVVDAGGHPLSMLRMDGASILSANTVIAKARTAVFCGRPTHLSVERAKTHPEVYLSLASEMEPGVIWSMGGFPLQADGQIVGGVAASGATGEQDILVAMAAVEHYDRMVSVGS